MKNYGFVRVAAASPQLEVANCDFNTTEIIKQIIEASKKGVSIVVFPEMCITAYTCGDLFLQRLLLDEAINSLNKICNALSDTNIVAIVGMPLEIANKLYNVGVVINKGKIEGVVPKSYLPNYNEFYEKRWFSSASELRQQFVSLCGQNVPIGKDLLFQLDELCFGIEVCEDLWTAIPPSSLQVLHGAEIIFNLSASNEITGKHTYRKSLIMQQSARCIAGYVYASAGTGESTTDLVFAGSSLITENGSVLAEMERFSLHSQLIISDIDVEAIKNERLKNKSFFDNELTTLQYTYRIIELASLAINNDSLMREVNPTPFIPSAKSLDERCSEIIEIQVAGLVKRLIHTHCKTAVIGVSGGLDSTLALLVIVQAFDKLNIPRKNIYGITMPGFGTTDRTYANAIELMGLLGVTIKEIPISESVNQHFKDIEHDVTIHDITYENAQARERTQILMDHANKVNGIVVGTGDLSELALGWCTYNGDHMSMYAVNSGVPKTLVKTLISWISATHIDNNTQIVLEDVINTPISPELLPTALDGTIAQITEDNVGPYILHDFFIYYTLRFGFEPAKIYFLAQYAFQEQFEKEIILKWLKVFFRRFFTQQFKRSCMPDGPKVGSINLSPRGDWRMPSDASSDLWMKQLDSLK